MVCEVDDPRVTAALSTVEGEIEENLLLLFAPNSGRFLSGALAHLPTRVQLQLRVPHPLRFSKGGILERLRHETFSVSASSTSYFLNHPESWSPGILVGLEILPFKLLRRDQNPNARVRGSRPSQRTRRTGHPLCRHCQDERLGHPPMRIICSKSVIQLQSLFPTSRLNRAEAL